MEKPDSVSGITHFSALGVADLRGPESNELLSILARPKLLALLAYLAAGTPRGFQRRDKLIGLFWPDVDQDRARNALRQSLHHLRRSLGEDVLVGRGEDEVGLAEGRFSSDVAAFETAIEEGRPEEALELYRGDLLEGFFLSDTPEFERWLDERRAQLRERASAAAWELAEMAATQSDPTAASNWARRALRFSPLDESLLRQAVGLMDRVGDRAGAVREYEAFAARLEHELEVEPAPETRALLNSVRSRSGVGPSPQVSRPEAQPVGEGRATPRLAGNRAFRLGLVAGSGLVLTVFFLWAFYGSGDEIELNPKRVVVTAFDNRSGDPDLDPLGRMAMDWVSRGLRQTDLVQVVPPEAALLPASDSEVTGTSRDPLQALAYATGAGIVVSGAVYASGDSIQIEAHVTDASKQRVMLSIEPAGGPRDDPIIAVETLRQRVVGALATVLDARIAPYTDAHRQPPTYEAYRVFVEAEELYDRAFNPGSGHLIDEAQRLFLESVELDSTLIGAWGRAAAAAAVAGRPAEADSLARIAERYRDRLSPFSEARLDMMRANLEGDRIAALHAARKQMQTPLDPAIQALQVNYPGETVEILEESEDYATLLGSYGLVGIEQIYWQVLTVGHHMRGDYRRELKAAQKARERNPNLLSMLELEVRALAALGRVDQVVDRLDESLSLPPQAGWLTARVMRVAAVELRAHGRPEAGLEASAREIDWYESRAPEENATRQGRFLLAESNYVGRRWETARSVYEELAREFPDNVHYKGYLGVLAARRSDRAEALRLSEELRGLADPYDFGRESYWQACIASQLGELDRAMVLLRDAYAQGKAFDLLPHLDLDLEPLHEYPPFQEFLRPKG
jgi:DNA-binding SARP family transcriptional activator/TolB-like protein